MTNVDHANLSCKQHCPHRVHFTQQMTVQNTAKRTLIWKRLASCGPRPGRCSVLISCLIVSRTHFILVILLCWVSNGSKQKHTALYHIVTWARRPFARIVIANSILLRSEVWAEQASTANYLTALLNAQGNATHQNAVQYCGEIFQYSSSFGS